MPKVEHLPAEYTSGLAFYTTRETYTHPFHYFWLGPRGYSFGTVRALFLLFCPFQDRFKSQV